MSKKLYLTIPEPLYQKLKSEGKKYSYSTTQQLILSILREKLFSGVVENQSKRGRPRKLDIEKIVSRKKIFSNKGDTFPL